MSSSVFFTSDTHFQHHRLSRRRGFEHTEDHDETLIRNWNRVVKRSDRVYHLGDFSFGSKAVCDQILSRLNGQKYLCRGNHDRVADRCPDHFVWIKDYHGLTIGEDRVYLFHYAMMTWNRMHYGSIHLHGHSHGSLREDPNKKRIDVGVDSWNLTPVAWETIKQKADKLGFRPVDHHGDRYDESRFWKRCKRFFLPLWSKAN